jgi:tRNA dimethylallyltransferase
MQVYRGMDVGTAKPTRQERREVCHHLVDVAEPEEEWSAARTQAAARRAVAEIARRGNRALLVGGSGLYVQAVVDRFELPGEDLALRDRLERQTSEPGGVAAAYADLAARDPVAAGRIDPHNVRRIVRALEVIQLTGRPFSSFGPGVDAFGETVFPVSMIGIWVPRDVLAERIARRVAAMCAAGLVEEVRDLAARPLSRTAGQAIGYREVLEHLEGGADAPDLATALGTTVRRTRSFARRQRMWFRRDPRITWLAAGHNPEVLAAALLAGWSRP